jgi:predicted transposase/invertase (TIGR01784 family)
MIPGIDPKVDYAFKKVFGSEANVAILRDLLEAVLDPPPEQRIVELEILNPFNDKETLDDKLSVLDIKVRDQSGRQYNVEMQMANTHVYPQRVLYYWAVLHGQQLHAGDDYRELRATISISFLDGVLFPDVPDYHLEFQLRSSKHHALIFSPHQSIHLVELPKFQSKAEDLVAPLDIWSYFLIHGGDLDKDNLPAALRSATVRQAMEVLKMMTQSDLERERYQSRLKAERDHRAILQEAEYIVKKGLEEGLKRSLEQGLEQGLKKGLKEGRELGRQEAREEGRQEGFEAGDLLGRIQICQRLLKLTVTPSEVLLATPMQDLRTQAKHLEQQLGLKE